MAKSEDELVAWLAARFPTPAPAVAGIGDDMAILGPPGGGLLVASDMLLDGVHFDSKIHTPEQIGRKALAVNLSDCAAMAVRPSFALVSLALPNSWSLEAAKGLYRGMAALAERFDCRIIGGDTNSWGQPLAIDVAVIAEPWPGVAPRTRNGVRIGDAVCVTGRLGGSRRGHHMDFEPRVFEARQLAGLLGDDLHALMDLSDGLSTDAARMAAASGCGIEFYEEAVLGVASEAARSESSQDRTGLLRRVLNDGEDFELLLSVSAGKIEAHCGAGIQPVDFESGDRSDDLSAAAVRPGTHVTLLPDSGATSGRPMELTVIGFAVSGSGVWMRRANAPLEPVAPGGWQHFTETGEQARGIAQRSNH